VDLRIYDHSHRQFTRGEPIMIEFEKQSYRAYAGEPVAVALFAAGVRVLSRSLKYHRPRTFFCLSGHCNGCLVRADGLPSVRGCMEACHEGQELEGQNAFPSSDMDVLGAVDWMFPHGMDHHTLMTKAPKLIHSAMQKMVRQLSGLGMPPSRPAASLPEPESIAVDVVVIGAGAAGLAAATAAARAGARTLCVDEHDEAGGSLVVDPRFGPAEAARRTAAARKAGVDLRLRAPTVAWFPEDEDGLLAVATPERLLRIKARRYVYATGAYDVNARFEDNDRPGVFAARAVGRLAVRYGVKPGEHVIVVGGGPYAKALAAELSALGIDTRQVDGTHEKPVRAHGRTWVESLEIIDDKGKKRKLPCDAIAVAALPSPASEAPRQHGARVELVEPKGGFAVLVDDDGRTTVPDVFAAGDVAGFVGPDKASAQGERAGSIAGREAVSRT
jgi:sarcosine oxidase subunit alpha